MSVERLYPNLSSSDLPWNRLPSIIFIILVSEDSEEEDGYDKEDEEDERLQCFFLRDLCLLGEREDFSINEDKEVLLQRRLLFEYLFLYEFFFFFVFRSISSTFPFFRDYLRRVPSANFPLIFVGIYEGRVFNYIIRMDLLPLFIFCCISCIIVKH